MLNKIAIGLASVTGFVGLMLNTAHGQAFSVSSSTQNATLGAFAQTVYDRLVSVLSTGGIFEFMVVMAILGLVIWLVYKGIRHIV